MGKACEIVTIEEIVEINRQMLQQFGGLFLGGDNFRNRESLEVVLESIIFGVFGRDLFPSVYDKAAAITETIARKHVFHDANKRTAGEVCRLMLEKNNLVLPVDEEIVKIILDVATGEMSVEELTSWLKETSMLQMNY